MLHDTKEGKAKILAFTDSSSALGWLFKASFASNQPNHDMIARRLAEELIEKDSALYSQHIKGCFNFIADSLSRDHHIPTDKLTFALRSLLPEQVPRNFEVVPPPPEAISFMHSLLLSETKGTELLPPPTRSKLGASIGGDASWEDWRSTMSGLKDSTKSRERNCCQLSQALVDEINMVRQRKPHSPEERSKSPSHMFVRPFGCIFGQIRPWVQTKSHPSS